MTERNCAHQRDIPPLVDGQPTIVVVPCLKCGDEKTFNLKPEDERRWLTPKQAHDLYMQRAIENPYDSTLKTPLDPEFDPNRV